MPKEAEIVGRFGDLTIVQDIEGRKYFLRGVSCSSTLKIGTRGTVVHSEAKERWFFTPNAHE